MRLFITNNQGEKIAVAVEGLENKGKNKLVFIQHGLSGHKGQTMIRQPVRAFVDSGYVAVSFDCRHSFGNSDGSLEFASLSSFIADLQTIITWAEKQDFFVEPFALSGHSLGGGSALNFAEKNPQRVSLLVPVAAMVGGKYFIRSRLLNDAKDYRTWQKEGKIYRENKNNKTKNGYLSFNVVTDMLNYNMVRDASKIACPTLIITGDNDLSSTVYNNQQLFNSINCKKDLVILKDCAHLYDKKHNPEQLYSVIFEWLAKNV